MGDYYIPGLKLPEESCRIGCFGQMHRDYLKQVYPARYHTLVLTYGFWAYLADLDEQAWEWLDAIMEQMNAAEGVTEELKAREQWV